MRYVTRLVITIPFAIAALLTVLMAAADPLHWHRERIAGYGFLFATPWGWFIDPVLLAMPRSWEPVLGYIVLLWIPALLYSACLWVLLRGLPLVLRHTSGHRGLWK